MLCVTLCIRSIYNIYEEEAGDDCFFNSVLDLHCGCGPQTVVSSNKTKGKLNLKEITLSTVISVT